MTEENRSEKKVILDVKNLHTYFYGRDEGVVWKILEGINFKIHRGETLGILGPSGVGKSVLALSILRLIEFPGKIEAGEIFYKEHDLFKITNEEFDNLRGRKISLVMQSASATFDPLRDMTYSTSQPFRAHVEEEPEKSEIKMLVVSQLGKVAIPDPLDASEKFAHQLSGGESQRIKIASALINNPDLLIADEPVANLDTTIARQILNLLHEMKEQHKLTMILIAHNLGVIAELSDYIAIMYAGKIIEYGNVETIFY
ncbi:MAG: ABC transporter ATP-binding protein, partial [Candidatus Heimdallarchaeota archaeon]